MCGKGMQRIRRAAEIKPLGTTTRLTGLTHNIKLVKVSRALVYFDQIKKIKYTHYNNYLIGFSLSSRGSKNETRRRRCKKSETNTARVKFIL